MGCPQIRGCSCKTTTPTTWPTKCSLLSSALPAHKLKGLLVRAQPLTLKSLSFRKSIANALSTSAVWEYVPCLDKKKGFGPTRGAGCLSQTLAAVVHERQVGRQKLLLLLPLFYHWSPFIIIVISLLLPWIWGTHAEHAAYLHLTERERLKISLRVFEITSLGKITKLTHETPLGFLYACWQG